MPIFPTLSQKPEYPLSEEREDSTIRSQFEGGYEHTRPRFTRIRKTFGLKYSMLPDADKTTLDDFITTVKGSADAFTWTHPKYGTQHNVRFTKPPKFEYVQHGYWNVEIELREV